MPERSRNCAPSISSLPTAPLLPAGTARVASLAVQLRAKKYPEETRKCMSSRAGCSLFAFPGMPGAGWMELPFSCVGLVAHRWLKHKLRLQRLQEIGANTPELNFPSLCQARRLIQLRIAPRGASLARFQLPGSNSGAAARLSGSGEQLPGTLHPSLCT